MKTKGTKMPNHIGEDTVRVIERDVFGYIVALMQEVCNSENLAQALLVPAAVLQQYDCTAVEVERRGGNEMSARGVACMAIMHFGVALRKAWEQEMETRAKQTKQGAQ